VFFAMFWSYFIYTQYLQFVHGYDPLAAGVRTLPWAIAYMVSATQSAKMVERFGQRVVVSSGLVVAGSGLAIIAATSSATSNYWLFALGLVVQALGMGLTTAPSTGAIMRSLPLHKAGVGSAVNDTTRELGGAVGVAVIGSVFASIYGSRLAGALPRALPAGAAHAAHQSLGAALTVAGELGGAHPRLAAAVHDGASSAFFSGFHTANYVTAGISAVGAVMALAFLPARPTAGDEATPEAEPLPAASSHTA
jgi:MFS family permease